MAGRRNVAQKGHEPIFELVPTENQKATMLVTALFEGRSDLPEIREDLQPSILPTDAVVFVAHEATKQEVRDEKYVTIRFLHVSEPISVSQYINKSASGRAYESRINLTAFHEALQNACLSDRFGKCFTVVGSGDVLPRTDAKKPAEVDVQKQVLRIFAS